MLMFNPVMTIQTTDEVRDPSYLSRIEMISINNETAYPSGPDMAMVVHSFTFNFDFWLNYPYTENTSIIETAIANMKDNSIDVNGVDLGTVTETGV